jgi:hypothetical protein
MAVTDAFSPASGEAECVEPTGISKFRAALEEQAGTSRWTTTPSASYGAHNAR